MISQDDTPDRGGETPIPVFHDENEQDQLAAIAQSEFHNRRRRDSLIRHDLFAEPAWDMLLHLYVERHRGQVVEVERLCANAAAATTTALRWIGILIETRLVAFVPAKAGDANIGIALSPHGVEEMERYLRDYLRRERFGGDIAAALQGR